MYSREIEQLLRENDQIISFEQYYQAFNPEVTTQIKIVSYDSSTESFYVLTKDDYFFHFKLEKYQDSFVKVKK